MLVLFDHGTPRGLARFLPGHMVRHAKSMGWDRLSNGALLAVAETAGFEVLVTPDKNLGYQQNLTERRIAIIVLARPQWPQLRLHVERVSAAVNSAKPGDFLIVIDS
jgi:hypothetical protein